MSELSSLARYNNDVDGNGSSDSTYSVEQVVGQHAQLTRAAESRVE